MKLYKKFVAHGLLVVLLCALATQQLACGKQEERPGIHYVLLLDMSGSISDNQRAEWMEKIELLLSKVFSAGDAILTLGIHSQTGNAAPIYQAFTEPLPANPVADDLQRWKRESRSIRKDGVDTIRQAFENARPSRFTDIFSAIDRAILAVSVVVTIDGALFFLLGTRGFRRAFDRRKRARNLKRQISRVKSLEARFCEAEARYTELDHVKNELEDRKRLVAEQHRKRTLLNIEKVEKAWRSSRQSDELVSEILSVKFRDQSTIKGTEEQTSAQPKLMKIAQSTAS